MTVHGRTEWNAAPPKVAIPALSPGLPYGVAHDIGGGDMWPYDVASTLHAIQANEQHGEYVDIAYCVGVDQRGDEWTLRGDFKDGATKGYAGISFSVLAICNANAPGFVMPPAMREGIIVAFLRARDRGILAPNAFIEGHHWFDAHVTDSPTACPSAVQTSVPAIKAGYAAPHTPAPAPSGGTLVTTVITGQKASNGRVPTARAVPAFNCVLLENGARVKGDHPSGDDHTWIPPIPAGSRLIDIAAYKVGDEPFVALYALPGGDVGTYVAELA